MKPTTKKQATIILITLFAVSVAFLFGFLITQKHYSPGIHVLGHSVHVDISEKCYIIDGNTTELLGDSRVEVQIDGTISSDSVSESKDATGSALVEGYPVEGIPSIGCFGKPGELYIDYHGIVTEADPNDNTINDLSFSNTHYRIYLADSPEDTVVWIGNFEEGLANLYAVCAHTPEEALERYQKFQETRYLELS